MRRITIITGLLAAALVPAASAHAARPLAKADAERIAVRQVQDSVSAAESYGVYEVKSTSTSSAAASWASSRTRRLLPEPGSPASKTTRPASLAAPGKSVRRVASSRERPTNGNDGVRRSGPGSRGISGTAVVRPDYPLADDAVLGGAKWISRGHDSARTPS